MILLRRTAPKGQFAGTTEAEGRIISDQEIGKKMVEEEGLQLFLEAYEHVTGQGLTCTGAGESPDFVCTRPDGEEAGVELTAITRSPDEEFAERILLRRDEQDSQDGLDAVFDALSDKEGKRAKHYTRFPGGTILVLQLLDCSLDSLLPLLAEDLQHDFQENGFVEVWLADYTITEAYGCIELFGLKPLRWWGRHDRPSPSAKPYG